MRELILDWGKDRWGTWQCTLKSYHGEKRFIALPVLQMSELKERQHISSMRAKYKRFCLPIVRCLSQDAWYMLKSKTWVSHSSLCPGPNIVRWTKLSPPSNNKHNCQQFANKENKMLKIEIWGPAECLRAETMMSERLPPHPLKCINMNFI